MMSPCGHVSGGLSRRFLRVVSYRRYRFFSHDSSNEIEGFDGDRKKQVVFLGTPSVAASSLVQLIDASLQKDSIFDVAAVVTKHMEGKTPRHTHPDVPELCKQHGIPEFAPTKVSDPIFLQDMQALQPDLFITAAYGNYLPSSFLKLSRFGTLNIHPSLLPKYRGAAPVQRSLENGDTTVGVTVLYTVKKMDAGPILLQHSMELQGHEKNSEVLSHLFQVGIEKLIDRLPEVFKPEHEFVYSKSMGQFSTSSENFLSNLPHVALQDGDEATLAPKLSSNEAQIEFSAMRAIDIHNRCRGFSEWPGVWSHFYLLDKDSNQENSSKKRLKIKLITTRVLGEGCGNDSSNGENEALYVLPENSKQKEGYFCIACKGGSYLAVDELQPVGKKVMKAKNFFNGLRGRRLIYDS